MSEHVKVQKDHLELKQKHEEIEKVKQTLHTIVQRVYQKVMGEGKDVPMEEKVRKVDDTITNLQTQV